jgi:hypothetical protein
VLVTRPETLPETLLIEELISSITKRARLSHGPAREIIGGLSETTGHMISATEQALSTIAQELTEIRKLLLISAFTAAAANGYDRLALHQLKPAMAAVLREQVEALVDDFAYRCDMQAEADAEGPSTEEIRAEEYAVNCG